MKLGLAEGLCFWAFLVTGISWIRGELGSLIADYSFHLGRRRRILEIFYENNGVSYN